MSYFLTKPHRSRNNARCTNVENLIELYLIFLNMYLKCFLLLSIYCLLYTSPSPRDKHLDLVCRLLLEKKFFFNDTATTEIYTIQQSSAASDVYKRQQC